MPGPRIDVMLVDDHAVVRMGFRLLIEAAPDMRVVAEAASGEAAVRVVEEARPDVVVMDISMPGIGGLEALRRILAKAPEARVLVLSAHEDAMHARRTLKAGAAGYLTKRSAAEALIEAISGRLSHQAQRRRGADRGDPPGLPGRELPRAADLGAARRAQPHAGAARYAEREGVQGLHRARERPVGPGNRHRDVAQPEHGRHASLQHQAEAGRDELGGARADRHARRLAHALASSRSSRAAAATGSTARTVTPSPAAP